MSHRRRIRLPVIVLHRRTCTRVLPEPWPFLYSVVDGQIVKNLPSVPQDAKKSRKKRRRMKIDLPG